MIYTIENTVEVGMPVYVYADGKEINHCVMADTGTGAYSHEGKYNSSSEEIEYIDSAAVNELMVFDRCAKFVDVWRPSFAARIWRRLISMIGHKS